MIIHTEFSRSEAEAYNTDRGLNNSDILRKPNSIIPLLFFLQQKQSSQNYCQNKKNALQAFTVADDITEPLLYYSKPYQQILPLSNGYIALNQTVILLFTLLSVLYCCYLCCTECTRSARATKQFEIMTYVILCVKINFLNLIIHQ